MCINYIKITLKSYLIKNVIPCIIVILGILRIYVGSHYRLPAPLSKIIAPDENIDKSTVKG